MSLVNALKGAGFTKEKSTEEQFEPFEGMYKTVFSACEEKVSQKNGAQQLQVDFKIEQALVGKESKSQYAEFRKWLDLDGENATDKKKGVAFIINALFTSGYDVNMSSDEAMKQSIKDALGTPVYIKAWGWQPEGGDKKFQQFSVVQESVALKAVKKEVF